MALRFIDEAEIEGKKILARFDFNVPLKNGVIEDTTRIDLALETIKFILEKKPSKLILMSHLGRPKGKPNPDYSLAPIGNYLAEQLNTEVILTESCIDEGINTLLGLPKSKVILLENLRFHEGETKNDLDFAKVLSSYGEIYVNDAFGTSHRNHASTYGVVSFFAERSYGGLLLKKEIEALSRVLSKPDKPFVAIMGGAKVADKIKTIETLLPKVDRLIIGGAMAYPFLKIKGHQVGKSLCTDEDVQLANSILRSDKGNKILLPIDHLAGESIEDNSPKEVSGADIPENLMGLDIGPKTSKEFASALENAKTIFWNGPMGLFESEAFSKGTFAIAETLAGIANSSYSIVGGGDSVNAAKRSGVSEKLSHISTGGGASLEFIEKGTLPGINALKFGVK